MNENSNGTLGIKPYCAKCTDCLLEKRGKNDTFLDKEKSFVMQFCSLLLPQQIFPVSNNFD